MMPNGLLTGVFSASCSVQRLSSGVAVRPIPAMVRTVFCCADTIRVAANPADIAYKNSRRVVIRSITTSTETRKRKKAYLLARKKSKSQYPHREPERSEDQAVAEHQAEIDARDASTDHRPERGNEVAHVIADAQREQAALGADADQFRGFNGD